MILGNSSFTGESKLIGNSRHLAQIWAGPCLEFSAIHFRLGQYIDQIPNWNRGPDACFLRFMAPSRQEDFFDLDSFIGRSFTGPPVEIEGRWEDILIVDRQAEQVWQIEIDYPLGLEEILEKEQSLREIIGQKLGLKDYWELVFEMNSEKKNNLRVFLHFFLA